MRLKFQLIFGLFAFGVAFAVLASQKLAVCACKHSPQADVSGRLQTLMIKQVEYHQEHGKFVDLPQLTTKSDLEKFTNNYRYQISRTKNQIAITAIPLQEVIEVPIDIFKLGIHKQKLEYISASSLMIFDGRNYRAIVCPSQTQETLPALPTVIKGKLTCHANSIARPDQEMVLGGRY